MLLHHQESLTNFIEVRKSNLDVSVMVLIGSIASKTIAHDFVATEDEDIPETGRYRSVQHQVL